MSLRGTVLVVALVLPLSGCLVSVATIVIDAERERLADLERFELEVASRDCAGLSDLHAELAARSDDLNDLDQRNDILREAMVRDGCTLPEGLE